MPASEQTPDRIDVLINQLVRVLPATTRAEIAEKLSRRTRTTVTIPHVDSVLYRIRRKSEEYGFTVPHVKRGINDEGSPRYFILDKTRQDGDYLFDDDPQSMAMFKDGLLSTVAEIAAKSTNEATALIYAAKHTRSTNLRTRLGEIADDLGYASRKLAILKRELVAEQEAERENGTAG